MPPGLGVTAGRLEPCPASPNCVSTLATDPQHAIAPIPFSIAPAAVLDTIAAVLASEPRVRIIARDSEYLHAEFRTRFLRFVDDVEFLVDGPAHLVQFRSASRVGESDLGVNRRRMTHLAARLAPALTRQSP